MSSAFIQALAINSAGRTIGKWNGIELFFILKRLESAVSQIGAFGDTSDDLAAIQQTKTKIDSSRIPYLYSRKPTHGKL